MGASGYKISSGYPVSTLEDDLDKEFQKSSQKGNKSHIIKIKIYILWERKEIVTCYFQMRKNVAF